MNDSAAEQIIKVPDNYTSVKVVKVKVRRRQAVTPSTIVCILQPDGQAEVQVNGPGYGKIAVLCKEGTILKAK